jgi:two-component system sensor histidine kinase/response regulator
LFETVGRFYKAGLAAAPAPAVERPPETTAAKTAEDLPELPGLDAKDGLARVAGNRKLYLKLLRQFLEQQGPAVEQITSALAQGDAALAERLAHTLKGVAGNLGAKTLQAAAGMLEKLIRDRAGNGDVEGGKKQVAAALEPLLQNLQAALGPPAAIDVPAPETVPPLDAAQARETAAHMTRLLSEFDPGAVDFLETNQAALRPIFKSETWVEFQKLVQSYSFADAQTQLEQACKQLPS